MLKFTTPGSYSKTSIRHPRFEISFYWRGKRHYIEPLPFVSKDHALHWIRRVFKRNGLKPKYYPDVEISMIDSFYDEWIKVTNDLKNIHMRRY